MAVLSSRQLFYTLSRIQHGDFAGGRASDGMDEESRVRF